jgi:vancomycin resistance protein YoaR
MSKGRPGVASGPSVDETARDGGGSPMDAFPDQDESRQWPRVLGVVAAVVLVLAGLYVGALWYFGDKVPAGATVAGVEIGGLTEDAAVERLEDGLAAATSEPIAVVAGERRTTLEPTEAGLELDARATVEGLTGFGLEPSRLWRHLFGAADVEPVTRVDRDALEAAVVGVSDSLRSEPVDGTVVFVDAQPQATDAETGTAVDVEPAVDLLAAEWLTASRPVELPTQELEPTITNDEVRRVMRDVARPLAGAPVSVAVADQLAELPVPVLTSTASFVAEEGRLELRMDGEALVEEVLARTTDLLAEAKDAAFEFQDGVPVIVPGTPGSTLEPEGLADAVSAAATGQDRTARVELVEVDPERTTAELESLGVETKVAEFSTPITADADRTHNLVVAARKVTGTLVRPEEVFSLNDTLNPVTAEAGYREAGVVVNGVLTKGVGGGLSQMGTTVYNVGFLAGLDDVEHRPHSFWFSRYPEGREATIYGNVLDVKIGNNTPYGVLLQSWVADGRLHVAAWSTPYWEVRHSTSERSDVVQPSTVYNTSGDCISQPAGNPGFKVTVTRRLLLDGEVQREESNSWRYKPQDAIVCGPPPGSAAADEDEQQGGD